MFGLFQNMNIPVLLNHWSDEEREILHNEFFSYYYLWMDDCVLFKRRLSTA